MLPRLHDIPHGHDAPTPITSFLSASCFHGHGASRSHCRQATLMADSYVKYKECRVITTSMKVGSILFSSAFRNCTVGDMTFAKNFLTFYPLAFLISSHLSTSVPVTDEKRATAVPDYVTTFGKRLHVASHYLTLCYKRAHCQVLFVVYCIRVSLRQVDEREMHSRCCSEGRGDL